MAKPRVKKYFTERKYIQVHVYPENQGGPTDQNPSDRPRHQQPRPIQQDTDQTTSASTVLEYPVQTESGFDRFLSKYWKWIMFVEVIMMLPSLLVGDFGTTYLIASTSVIFIEPFHRFGKRYPGTYALIIGILSLIGLVVLFNKVSDEF